MKYYMNNTTKLTNALLGNSKARQACVLFNFAREFKETLPVSAIASLLNGATNIILGASIVDEADMCQGFKVPTDEVENLIKQGCEGRVIRVKIVK